MEKFSVKRGLVKQIGGNAGLAKLATEYFDLNIALLKISFANNLFDMDIIPIVKTIIFFKKFLLSIYK